MRLRHTSLLLLCTLSLLDSADAAGSKQAAAQWLSQQLHRPIDASQVLVSPQTAALEGCTIARARRSPTGATSLSLHCPESILPELILLDFSLTPAPRVTNGHLLVHAGAVLRADWRTDSMHAQLPVIAMESGAAGGEIRVRISHSTRILRARILSDRDVAIVTAGA